MVLLLFFFFFSGRKKKGKAPAEHLPFKSPKQQRLERDETVHAMLQLQEPCFLPMTETADGTVSEKVVRLAQLIG